MSVWLINDEWQVESEAGPVHAFIHVKVQEAEKKKGPVEQKKRHSCPEWPSGDTTCFFHSLMN